jgi:hypothetical protein
MPKVTFNNTQGMVIEPGSGVHFKNSNYEIGQTKTGVLTASWSTAQGTGAEYDTGAAFPLDGKILITEIVVNVTDVGGTIDVGTLSTGAGGDADGFFDALNISGATGTYGPAVTDAVRGALSTDHGDGYAVSWYITGAGRNVSITPNSATSAGTITFHYYVV